MTPAEYNQLKAFARIDGLYVGLVWIGSFACYIYGLTSPLTGLVGMIAALVSPFYAAMRLKRYRDNVIGGVISFARAMLYYMLIFLYASLLLALAQFIYFEFLDNGYLAGIYSSVFSTPEAEIVLKAYGITKQQANDSVAAFAGTSAILIAVNILTINLFIGLIMSIPSALVMRRTAKPQS